MKKHKHSRNKPDKKQTNPTGKKGSINLVSGVKCLKGGFLLLDECKACEHHDNMSCKLEKQERKIEVIPIMHPMLFNRNIFQQQSDSIREDSINYYFKTDILNAVNNITDYPNYRAYKQKFIQGEFTNKEEHGWQPSIASFNVFSIVLFLNETLDVANCDIMVDKRMYSIAKPFTQIGDWEVLMYLYNTYSLEGFADYKIMDTGYKVLFEPVKDFPIDLVIARCNDKLIIGRMIK